MNKEHCETCKNFVEENERKRHIDPPKCLKAIDSKAVRPPMLAGYEEITYQCTQCGGLISYNNDKNDMLHWFLI